jgi:ATP-dependent Lhr-like helicase
VAARGAQRRETGMDPTVGYAATERQELVDTAFSIAPPSERLDAVAAIVRGWMTCIGPTTATCLAARLGMAATDVDLAMERLETDGGVLRGRFTPGAPDTEWCDRGLLARIHRLTLNRLRAEIEAVAPADFMRFLFVWQHVEPATRLRGRDGVRLVIGQLQGLELPGPGWERDVLPARIADYDPADLEQLCLAGEVTWGRLAVPLADDGSARDAARRRQAPTRSAPLALALRADVGDLLAPLDDEAAVLAARTPVAQALFAHLQQRGACFLADLARAVGQPPRVVEEGLWELVAAGLVTGDGIAGLRALLLPDQHRQPPRSTHLRALPGGGVKRMMPVGRWALLREHLDPPPAVELAAERAARRLLLRWGVVFRDLLARERGLPPWRALLAALRRLEARGEIRGGRFVDGFVGEQFALPEAVDALRSVRRRHGGGAVVSIAAADPLNLAGIVTPGARISPFAGLTITYRDGVPIQDDAAECGA